MFFSINLFSILKIKYITYNFNIHKDHKLLYKSNKKYRILKSTNAKHILSFQKFFITIHQPLNIKRIQFQTFQFEKKRNFTESKNRTASSRRTSWSKKLKIFGKKKKETREEEEPGERINRLKWFDPTSPRLNKRKRVTLYTAGH